MGKTAGRGVEVVETFLEELGKPAKVQITKKEFAFPENGEVHMGSNKKMPNNELEFQNWIRGTDWFKEFKSEYNEEPDLDTKDYDYRSAWKAGVQPERDPYDNNRFHWPSSLPTGKMLKSAEHPTAWKEYFMRETGVNPDALGLKTPEEANIFIENIFKGQEKAAGGEVQSDFFIDPSSYAQAKSKEMYPKKKSEWTERDAARHMLASGMMAQKFGPTTAKMAGLAHEHLNAPIKSLGYMLGLNKMPADYEQDLHNNALGIELAKRAVTQEELERFIKEMTSKSSKTKTEGVPFIGEPKNAARLSDY
jgi:hypothetical protein